MTAARRPTSDYQKGYATGRQDASVGLPARTMRQFGNHVSYQFQLGYTDGYAGRSAATAFG